MERFSITGLRLLYRLCGMGIKRTKTVTLCHHFFYLYLWYLLLLLLQYTLIIYKYSIVISHYILASLCFLCFILIIYNYGLVFNHNIWLNLYCCCLLACDDLADDEKKRTSLSRNAYTVDCLRLGRFEAIDCKWHWKTCLIYSGQ